MTKRGTSTFHKNKALDPLGDGLISDNQLIVTGIQSIPVSSAPPSDGQVLTYVAGNTDLEFKNSGGAITDLTTIRSLSLWLDASKIVGLNDGDPITTWLDSSGSGNNYGSSTSKPIYKTSIINGHPVVRFATASSQFLYPANKFTPLYTNTVFIVAKASYGTLISNLQQTPISGGFTFGNYLSKYLFQCGDGVGVWPTTSIIQGYFDFSVFDLYTLRISEQLGVFEAHGLPFGSVVKDTSPLMASGDQTYGLMIGALYAGGTLQNFISADIAEIAIFNRSLTSYEMGLVENYFSTKYLLIT